MTLNWTPQPTSKGIVLSVEGPPKGGKTHLCFTAPAPISYHGIDLGHDGVIQKFWDKGKKIGVGLYPYNRKAAKTEDMKVYQEHLRTNVWGVFVADVYEAIEKKVRSMVWDRGDEFWELLRLAHFGKLEQNPMQQYGVINAEFKDLVRAVKDAKINLLMIHALKEEYEEEIAPNGKKVSRKTGRMKRAGFSQLSYLVDAWIEMTYVFPQFAGVGKERTQREEGYFLGKIQDSRMNKEMVAGLQLVNPDFMTIAQMMVPELPAAEWDPEDTCKLGPTAAEVIDI